MLEVLKDKNVRVIASEPLQSMCEQLKLMVPDTEIIQCPAENIRKLLKTLCYVHKNDILHVISSLSNCLPPSPLF